MATPAQDHRFEAALRRLAASASGPVVVFCAEAPAWVARGRLGVRLDACLADTPAYRLVDLVLSAGQPVVVSLQGCTGAPDTGALTALSHLVGVQRLTMEPGGTPSGAESGTAGPVVDVAHPPVSRRGLLAARRDAGASGHDAVDDEARLIESLRRAGVAEGAAAAPGVRLAVTACTACGLCVRTCPHGALDLTHEAGRSRLEHLPDRCRGERVCVSVCPVGGLGAGDAPTWQEVLAGARVLVDVASWPCGRCGARTTRSDRLCAPCAFRREHPFGSAGPPSLRNRGPAAPPTDPDRR